MAGVDGSPGVWRVTRLTVDPFSPSADGQYRMCVNKLNDLILAAWLVPCIPTPPILIITPRRPPTQPPPEPSPQDSQLFARILRRTNRAEEVVNRS